jgi:hypothetical protein
MTGGRRLLKSLATVPFYRRCGWRQVNEDGAQIVVFLSPGHPYEEFPGHRPLPSA